MKNSTELWLCPEQFELLERERSGKFTRMFSFGQFLRDGEEIVVHPSERECIPVDPPSIRVKVLRFDPLVGSFRVKRPGNYPAEVVMSVAA